MHGHGHLPQGSLGNWCHVCCESIVLGSHVFCWLYPKVCGQTCPTAIGTVHFLLRLVVTKFYRTLCECNVCSNFAE